MISGPAAQFPFILYDQHTMLCRGRPPDAPAEKPLVSTTLGEFASGCRGRQPLHPFWGKGKELDEAAYYEVTQGPGGAIRRGDFFCHLPCHCEPVTDVTGAAIRFLWDDMYWRCGFPRQCAHWLGMTKRVCYFRASSISPCQGGFPPRSPRRRR